MGKKKPVQQTRRPSVGASSRIYSRDNVSRYSERARQRRRGKLIRRTIVCTLLAVLLCGVSAAGLWVSKIASNLHGVNITSDLACNVGRQQRYKRSLLHAAAGHRRQTGRIEL